jgi:hypothetical protein
MRGAGDANRDGQVSVDEAYRYAYHQTLLATASTAVGGQHVTLEVDLKGHGEVPLSFPRAATASIELPAMLDGQAIVQDRRAKAVVAETYKAKGAAVRIAVAPGDYEVTVRQGTRLLRCQVVAPGAIVLDRCTSEAIVESANKGGAASDDRPRRWRLELTAGAGSERGTDFTRTLTNFGFHEQASNANVLTLAVARETRFRGNYLGGYLSLSSAPGWERETELQPLRFDWTTTSIGVASHAEQGLTRRLFLYGDIGGGIGIGRTQFVDQDGKRTHEMFYGATAYAAAGLGFRDVVIDALSLTIGVRSAWAPVIENNLGETHDSGGTFGGFGLSYTYGGSR